MKVIGKNKELIQSWSTWERPRNPERQWVEGRSAMEIAKAFFRSGPQVPQPLNALLSTSPIFEGFVASEARPEFVTNLPPTGSTGPRNHDVWLRGTVRGRKVGIGIEAKADEGFDAPLAQKQRDALEGSKDSRFPERLATLGNIIFGSNFNINDPAYGNLGYQLLSGLTGTLIQAAHDDTPLAVFVIYEFISSKTSKTKQANNAAALDAFVRLLPGALPGLAAGTLIGPIPYTSSVHVPRTVELFMGKVVDNVASTSTSD